MNVSSLRLFHGLAEFVNFSCTTITNIGYETYKHKDIFNIYTVIPN